LRETAINSVYLKYIESNYWRTLDRAMTGENSRDKNTSNDLFDLQACDCLGVSKECDYFGLKYQNAKGEELWLNLRNPIERQTGGGVAPLRFALRVKFWVPPHLLLQEATR